MVWCFYINKDNYVGGAAGVSLYNKMNILIPADENDFIRGPEPEGIRGMLGGRNGYGVTVAAT